MIFLQQIPQNSLERRGINMHKLLMLAVAGLFCVSIGEAGAADPYAGNDPYWVLLHEPAAIAELNLTPVQERSFQKLMDELDSRFFPVRNQSQEVARGGTAKITSDALTALETLLQPAQRARLNELVLRTLGNEALLHDEVVKRLNYSDEQKRRIQEINEATKTAVAALRKEASEGKPQGPLEKRFQELQMSQQKKLLAVLKIEQQAALKKALGRDFDLSKLGRPRFKAPELVNTGQWINASSPLKLTALRGKVVVIHFYACGCINCIRNFAWYRQWRKDFPKTDVVILGIHTPETAAERNAAHVRQKAVEAGFDVPILIDGKNENWNAWGNSMWPTVYLVDKQGYLRDFWQGELNWQGNNGEKYMREQIERLRKEESR